jgi:hypothetical protein
MIRRACHHGILVPDVVTRCLRSVSAVFKQLPQIDALD